LTPNQKQALLQFFKAVGQPERAKMLGLAASRPHTVIELAELLGLKEMDALNQVTKLQKAGLIIENRNEAMPTYQLDTAALAQLQQDILENAIPEEEEV
jgi:DNA-binding MarR family transcriptional regulator